LPADNVDDVMIVMTEHRIRHLLVTQDGAFVAT
jgi:hypothetical protein